MANKLEKVCLGHTIKFKKECYNCIQDEYNKYCDKYKPLQIFYIEDGNKNRD